MEPPLVSILVPNYNHARFLGRRFDSIAVQQFQDYELICLDDCSKDDSRDVIRARAERMPMRVHFNERNSGSPCLQWRRGAEMARGRYLWIAESDDYADPAMLGELVARISARAGIGLAYCQSFLVDANGATIGTFLDWMADMNTDRWRADFVNNGRDEIARYLVQRNTVPNASATLVDRQRLIAATHGAESMRLTGDWWTWVRVLFDSDVSFAATPMNYFRTHASTVRETSSATLRTAEELRVLAHICSRMDLPAEDRRRIFRRAFRQWQSCFQRPGSPPTRDWFNATVADAVRIVPAAKLRMSAYWLKQRIKAIPPIGASVRVWKRVCGD